MVCETLCLKKSNPPSHRTFHLTYQNDTGKVIKAPISFIFFVLSLYFLFPLFLALSPIWFLIKRKSRKKSRRNASEEDRHPLRHFSLASSLPSSCSLSDTWNFLAPFFRPYAWKRLESRDKNKIYTSGLSVGC